MGLRVEGRGSESLQNRKVGDGDLKRLNVVLFEKVPCFLHGQVYVEHRRESLDEVLEFRIQDLGFLCENDWCLVTGAWSWMNGDR